jgi:hypothetical protein
MAATDCAIRQIRHSVALGESARNCVPSVKSNDWRLQKCAACATVATRSNVTHRRASHFAPAVFVRMSKIAQPSDRAYSETALIRGLPGDFSTPMTLDWNLLSPANLRIPRETEMAGE